MVMFHCHVSFRGIKLQECKALDLLNCSQNTSIPKNRGWLWWLEPNEIYTYTYRTQMTSIFGRPIISNQKEQGARPIWVPGTPSKLPKVSPLHPRSCCGVHLVFFNFKQTFGQRPGSVGPTLGQATFEKRLQNHKKMTFDSKYRLIQVPGNLFILSWLMT